MNQPVYRLIGWSRRNDMSLGSCGFSIKLDARFAEQARLLTFEHQRQLEERVRELVGYKYARATFLGDTGFLRSMSVEGNCACLGVSGNFLDADWTHMASIRYDGHNVDSKTQAYDLLTIFAYWVETVEAFLA